MLSACVDVHGSRLGRHTPNTEAKVRYRYLRLLAALPLAAALLYQPGAPPIPAHPRLYARMSVIQKRLRAGVGTRPLLQGTVDPQEQDTAAPNTYYPTSDNGC